MHERVGINRQEAGECVAHGGDEREQAEEPRSYSEEEQYPDLEPCRTGKLRQAGASGRKIDVGDNGHTQPQRDAGGSQYEYEQPEASCHPCPIEVRATQVGEQG